MKKPQSYNDFKNHIWSMDEDFHPPFVQANISALCHKCSFCSLCNLSFDNCNWDFFFKNTPDMIQASSRLFRFHKILQFIIFLWDSASFLQDYAWFKHNSANLMRVFWSTSFWCLSLRAILNCVWKNRGLYETVKR